MILFYFNLLEIFYFNQRIIIYFLPKKRVNIQNTTIFEPVILTGFYTSVYIMLQKMRSLCLRQNKETTPFQQQIEMSRDQVKFGQIQFKIILLK